MARRDAEVVGIDPTPNQIETAKRLEKEYQLGLEFVEVLVEHCHFLTLALILLYLNMGHLYGQTLMNGFLRQQGY